MPVMNGCCGCTSVRDGTVPGDIYNVNLQSTIQIKNFSSHSFTYNPAAGAPAAGSEPAFDGRFTLGGGVYYTPTVHPGFPNTINWLGRAVYLQMSFTSLFGGGGNSFALNVYFGSGNHWTFIKKRGTDYLGLYCLVKPADFASGATTNFLLTDEPLEIVTP